MSASYVALAVELPDLEEIYPILEYESQARRQAALLAFVNEQFDSEYEEDLAIEDVALEGGRLVVDFQCSTELCNEISHALFEGLSERDGRNIAALEYNSRIGVYNVLVPGYDEAEYVDECFDDFDGLMHELEDVMDRREQLMHMLELMETEPVASALREYLGEDEDSSDERVGRGVAEAEEGVPGVTADEDGPVAGESEPDTLMDKLKQAMADNDEERANELMERVQKRTRNG